MKIGIGLCVLLLYTLYMSGMLRHGDWWGMGRREDSLQVKNGKSGGVFTPFISKNRLKSLCLKTTA